jgi:hypothetical protein
MNDIFQFYASQRLSRALPGLDLRQVDAYFLSDEFRRFTDVVGKKVLESFDRYLDSVRANMPPETLVAPSPAPAPQPVAVPEEAIRPLAFPALTAPPPPSSPEDRLPSMAPNPLYNEALARLALPAPASPRPAPQAQPVPPPTQPALAQPDLADAAFLLPNARAGNAYQHRIEPEASSEAVVFLRFVIPDGLSMTADLDTGTISGTPVTAGEYAIIAIYHFARQSATRQRRASIGLSVTPDPRTMWKNQSSARDDPYWKPDEECGSVQGADLRIVAASKRGRSHAHVGSFRDDDYRIAHVPESGWYVAVVADGAGSARYSRRGAAIICEEAKARVLGSLAGATLGQIDTLAQAYAQARADEAAPERRASARDELHTVLSRIVGNAAYYALRAILEETARRTDLGAGVKDYSSTALIGICKRYPFGTLCAAYWVGDGAIGIYSRGDGVTLLGDVDSGEFSGQTRFLDHAAVDHEVLRKRTRFELVEDMAALVLMTDGVSDAKFETEACLHRSADWHQFWGELDTAVGLGADGADQERKLLDWLDFWSQGNHDDRTIALIY